MKILYHLCFPLCKQAFSSGLFFSLLHNFMRPFLSMMHNGKHLLFINNITFIRT